MKTKQSLVSAESSKNNKSANVAKNTLFLLALACTLLIGCGTNNQIGVSTKQGNCAAFNLESTAITESIPAPYCMAVTITNNAGGQNFINSTNSPITNLTMTITGAGNISSPATNRAVMDPNNCMGATLAAGSNCIFYLQISQESYPVSSIESVVVTLNYNVNNTLFGGSNTTASTPFTIYEVTNLYITQNSGWLTFLNSSSTPLSSLLAESADVVNDTTTDNSTFGYLYFAGNNGVYQYGEESTTSSISPSGFSGANNLINSGGNIYAAATNNTGIYQWVISSNSWLNNGTSAVFPFNNKFNSNVNALSPSGTQYLALTGQVYNCASVSGSNSCNQEVNNNQLFSNVTSLGFMATATNNTGLYAGTTSGLFVESGTLGSANASTNSWTNIVNADSAPITTQINSITNDGNGNLYAGDSSGNIWLITATSQVNNTASKLYTLTAGSIQQMLVDKIANVLYFTTASNQLYACALGTTPSCSPTLLSTLTSPGTVVAMSIGSQLNSSN